MVLSAVGIRRRIIRSKRGLSDVHNGLVEVALCGPTASG
jgi:hypothetical protein